MVLALKYATFEEAYRNHEDEIGDHLSRVTVSNIYRETRRTLKLFDQMGVIDQSALKRLRRQK
jgi:hypothetical protein